MRAKGGLIKPDDPIIDRCHREKVCGVYCTSLPEIWLICEEWLTKENQEYKLELAVVGYP